MLVLAAIYSASIVESAISVCNLLDHVTGEPPREIRKPVRDRTLEGSWGSSFPQIPAKSASTTQSRFRSFEGLSFKP